MAIQSNKIKSAIMEFRNGSEVPVEKYINLPITWESVLDETQDTAKILMTEMRQSDFDQYGVRIDKPFDAGTPIEIKFEGQHTFIRMIVARDTAEMVRKDGFPTWSHNIEFVDEVHKLEQEPVDNLTFKNPVPRRYDAAAGNDWCHKGSNDKYLIWTTEYGEEQTNGWEPPPIGSVYPEGILYLSDNASKFNTLKYTAISGMADALTSLKLIVTLPNGEQRTYSSTIPNITYGESYSDTVYEIVLDQTGEYRLEFIENWFYTGPTAGIINHECSMESWIFVGDISNNPTTPYTIKETIDRILSLTPTRTVRGNNKYTFRNNAEEYATEESPEFTFTGKHLFEVMLDIASYKKMFPALYKNEIYFRPFWNGEMLTSSDLPSPTKAVLCSAIDQYCTALDSYVENMVCINDSQMGTVVEPYKNGYISSRSGGGSEISETTAIIPTQSDIYQTVALNMGKTDGIVVGDILPYVYEQEEYDSLSDTSAAYPYSKGYALKFTRFSKNYTELSHRIDSESNIAEALKLPAIANIVKAQSGGGVGMNLKSYLSGFIKEKTTAPFADLLFQPTYIPVVNARVRQYKPLRGQGYEATLFYNQQEEVVDSEAFGEHVKGLVQKLGNHTEIRVYRFERIDDVPTVGTIIDEKSVYDAAMTIYENYVDATICLVDYAELSMHIGVKNEIKTSDISTTKWCNRFINWEEFFVFTHDDITGDALSVTGDSLNDIVNFTNADPLTCAIFTHYTEDGAEISTAFAPIKHLALGNSIYFQWEMLDNFAVGYQSEKAPEGATSAWTGTQYDRAQKAVRYCDIYGRTETVDFYLLKNGPTPDNTGWRISEDGIAWWVDENNEKFYVQLKKKISCYVIAWFRGQIVDPYGSGVPSLVLAPGETTASMAWGWTTEETTFDGASLYTGTNEAKELAAVYIQTQIAHSYPQKPNELVFSPTIYASNEEQRPTFQLADLLIKKNSAEALKYAAQYHFQQDWREFVIGSGMSNFCSLVGGSCSQLQLFISAFPINRFDRHVDLSDTYNNLILDELPSFAVDEENMRVIITLPSKINDGIEHTKSWGLVGIDKNGNRQLIFGENKNAKNEAFLTTIYLVPMQKNNEPQARATYTLARAKSTTSVGCWVYIDGELTGGIEYGSSMEIPRRASVMIYNSHYTGVNLTLSKIKMLGDGSYEIVSTEQLYIKYRGSYTFTLTTDMAFNVWTTGSSGGGGTIVM